MKFVVPLDAGDTVWVNYGATAIGGGAAAFDRRDRRDDLPPSDDGATALRDFRDDAACKPPVPATTHTKLIARLKNMSGCSLNIVDVSRMESDCSPREHDHVQGSLGVCQTRVSFRFPTPMQPGGLRRNRVEIVSRMLVLDTIGALGD
jgi:hypothetical protein